MKVEAIIGKNDEALLNFEKVDANLNDSEVSNHCMAF